MDNHSYQHYLQNNTIFKVLVEESVSPVGLYVGRDMVIKLANKAILEIWDKGEDVIGKTFRQALPELEGQPFFDLLDNVFTTGIAYEAHGERVDLFVDGRMQTYYFNFTYKPLKNDDGEVWGVMNTAADVTELVLTRQKLAETEERTRFALDSAQLGTWDMDPSSEKVNWDARCNKLHGFEEGEVATYADVLKNIHPGDRALVEQRVKEAIDPKGNGYYDLKFRVINPRTKQVSWLNSVGKGYFNDKGNCIRFAGITLDITNEINDKDEQQKLVTLIDNTSDFVSLSDLEGNISYVNAAGRKMIGWQDDEIAQHYSEFLTRAELHKVKEITKSLQDTGRWSGEVAYRHFVTGETIPVYATTMVIHDRAGNPQGRATISRDLRAEIANKQALVDSEQLLQNITGASPTALWMSDHTGRITYVNKTWINWTGLSYDESLGRGWLGVILPEDVDRAARKLLSDLNARLPYEVDFKMRRADGEIRWCIATGNPQYNTEGVFMGYVGALTDVTELTQIDVELQSKNAALNDQIKQFEFVTDFMPVQLWTARTTGEIDYVNQRTVEYFGLSATEIAGANWISNVHPDDHPGCLAAWNSSLQSGKLYKFEFRLRDKDGNFKWHLARALPYMNNGAIVKWFGTNTDIDEQKQMQRQKDDFLGIASHELKTPVTSIKAYAQVLGAMLSKEGEDKKAEMVMKMDSQLNRLTNLIGDLLDVTKINSGKIQFNKTNFDFNKAVQECIQDLQHTTHKHLLVMDFKETGSIYSDKDRIGQVITNLVTNAIKYSPQSNRIIISTELVEDQVVVCVQDFGIGIANDKKNRVFEQFYRVSGSKQHTFPGLGLGLYISNEIIRREGGKMWVNSIEGKGSTFCFSLPTHNDVVTETK